MPCPRVPRMASRSTGRCVPRLPLVYEPDPAVLPSLPTNEPLRFEHPWTERYAPLRPCTLRAPRVSVPASLDSVCMSPWRGLPRRGRSARGTRVMCCLVCAECLVGVAVPACQGAAWTEGGGLPPPRYPTPRGCSRFRGMRSWSSPTLGGPVSLLSPES